MDLRAEHQSKNTNKSLEVEYHEDWTRHGQDIQ